MHSRIARCDCNTQMSWPKWDVKIGAKCKGWTFGLTGEDGAECFEGVELFKHWARVLHRSEEDRLVVRWNIWSAIQFWGRLGKLLSREVAEPIISAKFYRTVVQAVLLFGLEILVLKVAILEKMSGHM